MSDEYSTGTSSDSRLDDDFPLFIRNNISPGEYSESVLGGPNSSEVGFIYIPYISKDLLEKIKNNGEQAEAQKAHDVPLTPVDQAGGGQTSPTTPATLGQQNGSAATQNPMQAQTTNSGAIQPTQPHPNQGGDFHALINKLNKPPHVIPYHGTILDRSERLKIIAAVAICESGHNPFKAENLDTEFHKMPSANLTYGHIVHIGLSFGIIQFTQDSGSLGKLLVKMHGKNSQKFGEIFGDNFDELITLTTIGISVPGISYSSGQGHWRQIKNTAEGHQLANLAAHNNLPVNREIRGRRVQPIAVNIGGEKKDLWVGEWKQRFQNSGDVDDFQEAELEFAVEGFMNPALPYMKQNNIRSGLGLAFVTACAVRGANKGILGAAATHLGQPVPFQGAAQERRALQLVADLNENHANNFQGIAVQKDEIIRARKLLVDETGFLIEDLYDTDTYDNGHDN